MLLEDYNLIPVFDVGNGKIVVATSDTSLSGLVYWPIQNGYNPHTKIGGFENTIISKEAIPLTKAAKILLQIAKRTCYLGKKKRKRKRKKGRH